MNTYSHILEKQAKEMAEWASNSFQRELAANNFQASHDVTDTLKALGLSLADVKNSPMLTRELRKAVQIVLG